MAQDGGRSIWHWAEEHPKSISLFQAYPPRFTNAPWSTGLLEALRAWPLQQEAHTHTSLKNPSWETLIGGCSQPVRACYWRPSAHKAEKCGCGRLVTHVCAQGAALLKVLKDPRVQWWVTLGRVHASLLVDYATFSLPRIHWALMHKHQRETIQAYDHGLNM